MATISEQQPITPTDKFFVKSHSKEIPQVSEAEYRLHIDGLVDNPMTLSLEQIKRNFPHKTGISTISCKGSGEFPSDDVAPEAQAKWGGAPLSEVLKQAKVRPGAGVVSFTGLDKVQQKEGSVVEYAGSIPIDVAMSEEVLLAYEMNDEKLPAAHGGPLRVVVPHMVGNRSVKWVAKISVLQQ